MGPVERVQSQLRRGRDPEDAEGDDKTAPGRHAVSASKGDQMVRQRESVFGEHAGHRHQLVSLVVIVRAQVIPPRTRVPK